MAFTTGTTKSLWMNTESFSSSLAVVCALLLKDLKVFVSVIECFEKMWRHDANVKTTDLMLSRFPAIALSFKIGSEKG